MQVLVVAEHDGKTIRPGSRSALEFAWSVAKETAGSVAVLVLGHGLADVAAEAARFAPLCVADHPGLEHVVADRWASVIARTASDHDIDLLVAAANTFSKDVVSRAAGLLGGAMASDVIGHEFRDGRLHLRRPIYAGAVTATVVLQGEPQIVTVRPSAYPPASPGETANHVTAIEIADDELPDLIQFEGLQSKQTDRPDVTEARVVVSGGRAMKNSEDFERLVGTLADALGGATGSSRALVDAGITPNELQVGQTGKIVAPDLYLALGISGAVQHLAGMKNSKVIVAINNDPDAPIFEVADYGLVGDVYEVVPQIIEKLHAS